MDENKVTLSLDEFLMLRDKACDLDTLLDTIFSTAKKSAYLDYLSLDDHAISNVLEVIAPKHMDKILGSKEV